MKKKTLAIIAIALAAAVALARIVGVASRREAPRYRYRQYRESPILRERVDRGELPPVEKRLPAEPMVVPPVDGIGRYDSDPVRPR